MKNILYSSPYIPSEWIAAHGFNPSRISPGFHKRLRPIDTTEGICPYMKAFLIEAREEKDTAAVCFSTACDQMRRASERFNREDSIPVFLMHVPATWKSMEAHRLYFSELKRLGVFLFHLGGKQPTGEVLYRIMQAHDEKRSLLKNLKGYLPPRAFAEAVAWFNRTGKIVQKKQNSIISIPGVPVALLGGPLTAQDFGLYDIIFKAGGYVVLDGTDTGERTLPRSFHRQHMREDPFLELGDAYFGSIPDVFRRPNSELYMWMRREFSAYAVKGVILVRNVWCDIWHGEVRRIQEWLSVPLLDIDLNGENPVLRNKTRIQAFLELLQ